MHERRKLFEARRPGVPESGSRERSSGDQSRRKFRPGPLR